MRNRITALTRISKKIHFRKYFEINSQNVRKTWTGIKHIINSKPSMSNPTSLLTENGMEMDPTKIAENFNSYFPQLPKSFKPKYIQVTPIFQNT